MREGSGSLTPAEARVAVTFRGDQPDLGRAYGVEADFLEILILPISVSDRPLPRFWTGEDRHLDPAVIVDPLNPPLAGVHSIHKSVDKPVDNSICGGISANLSVGYGCYSICLKNRQAFLNLLKFLEPQSTVNVTLW